MKRILSAVLLGILVFMLTGCGFIDTYKDMKAKAAQLLDATLAGDTDAAYEMLYVTIERDDFDANVYAARDMLAGTDEYKLGFRSFNSTVRFGGEFRTEVVFRLKSDAGIFFITMIDTSDFDTIEYFEIVLR